MTNHPSHITRCKAFTLIEVLVSMTIVSTLLFLLITLTNSTQKIWTFTNSKIEEYRDAREAFESITRRLSQATLNTYWDYNNVNAPTKYIRQSELRFVSGNAKTLSLPSSCVTHGMFFQAPLGYVSNMANYKGLVNLINTCGYFVEYSDDSNLRPSFISQALLPYKKRFRLMEMFEPSDQLTLYEEEVAAGGNSKYVGKSWFTAPLQNYKQVLAENIIALVILPKLSPADQAAGNYKDSDLAPAYLYDSTGTGMSTLSDPKLNPTNQLPPVVQVSLVALDEASASKMTDDTASALQGKLNTLFAQSKNQISDLRRDTLKYPDNNDDPSLEAYLISQRLGYRIFTTNVSIKAAKWSRGQKN